MPPAHNAARPIHASFFRLQKIVICGRLGRDLLTTNCDPGDTFAKRPCFSLFMLQANAGMQTDMSEHAGTIRHRRPIRYRQITVDEDNVLDAEKATFDRIKISLPYLRISPSTPSKIFFDSIKTLVQRSRYRISLVRRGSSIIIAMQPKYWHFDLKIRLGLTDGTWIGSGTLEVNAIRLFASICRKRDVYDYPNVLAADLVMDSSVGLSHSLDGKDNYIAKEHLGWANSISWPKFVQRYCQAIVDIFLGIFTEADTSDKLLELPPFYDWVWREVEVCYEFYDDDAASRVAVLSKIMRSLANEHKETSFENRKIGWIQDSDKNRDMLSTRVKLTKFIELAVYAKLENRLRTEIRYKSNVFKSVKLATTAFRNSPTIIEDVLGVVTIDAAHRANKALTKYRTKLQAAPVGLTAFSLALSHAATACAGRPDLLRHLISQLIMHQGIASSKSPSIQRVLDALFKEGVLAKPKLTLRDPKARYVLTEGYYGTFAALGQTDFATALLASDTLKPKE